MLGVAFLELFHGFLQCSQPIRFKRIGIGGPQRQRERRQKEGNRERRIESCSLLSEPDIFRQIYRTRYCEILFQELGELPAIRDLPPLRFCAPCSDKVPELLSKRCDRRVAAPRQLDHRRSGSLLRFCTRFQHACKTFPSVWLPPKESRLHRCAPAVPSCRVRAGGFQRRGESAF